jgi:hypothetical protein
MDAVVSFSIFSKCFGCRNFIFKGRHLEAQREEKSEDSK